MAGSIASPLREWELRTGQLRRLSAVLLFVLPLLAVGLGWDFLNWVGPIRQPLEPVPPDLAGLREPLEEIPSLSLLETLFSPAPAVSENKPTSASAAALAPPWKVKGVVMGDAPRAFLEDAEGKQRLWVTQGQQAGAFKVKRIDERSVTLEADGTSYEIRL